MARTDPQINIRLPSSLKEKLEAAALDNDRSLTAEVTARLQQSFGPVQAEHDGLEKRVASIELALGSLTNLVETVMRMASHTGGFR